MGRRMRRRMAGVVALAIAASGCASTGARQQAATAEGLTIAFETVEAPEAFFRDGLAVADRADGASGFWAAVPRLPRPERALIVNPATEAAVEVALFAGGSVGAPVRLSGAAAEALGIGAEPVRVRITALRRQPRLVAP